MSRRPGEGCNSIFESSSDRNVLVGSTAAAHSRHLYAAVIIWSDPFGSFWYWPKRSLARSYQESTCDSMYRMILESKALYNFWYPSGSTTSTPPSPFGRHTDLNLYAVSLRCKFNRELLSPRNKMCRKRNIDSPFNPTIHKIGRHHRDFVYLAWPCTVCFKRPCRRDIVNEPYERFER